MARPKPVKTFKIHRYFAPPDSGVFSLRIPRRAHDAKPRVSRPSLHYSKHQSDSLHGDLNEPWTSAEIRAAMEIEELREDLLLLTARNVQQSIQNICSGKRARIYSPISLCSNLRHWRYGMKLNLKSDPAPLHASRRSIRDYLSGVHEAFAAIGLSSKTKVQIQRTFRFLRYLEEIELRQTTQESKTSKP